MWRGPTGISCAQHRAVFEGEVHDTISIHCDLLNHSVPQRRRELDYLLIAVNQLFCKGYEHFALRGTAGTFGLDGLIPISGILITLSQLFAEEENMVSLTDSQKKLLESWSRLTEEQQAAVFTLIDRM